MFYEIRTQLIIFIADPILSTTVPNWYLRYFINLYIYKFYLMCNPDKMGMG